MLTEYQNKVTKRDLYVSVYTHINTVNMDDINEVSTIVSQTDDISPITLDLISSYFGIKLNN